MKSCYMFCALIMLVCFGFNVAVAQPPTPILITTDGQWLSPMGTPIPFGYAVQVIKSGADHVIQPPTWGSTNQGLTTGDDRIILTDTIGSGQPPISMFAGTFAIGLNVYSNPDSTQIGIGDGIYVRVFGAISPANATWYATSTLYTTHGGGETDTVNQATTGVKNMELLSRLSYDLSPAYPNPCNSTVVIKYSLPQSGNIDLAIYNALGQRVMTLVSGTQPAKSYIVRENLARLASGSYFIRLRSEVSGERIQRFNFVK